MSQAVAIPEKVATPDSLPVARGRVTPLRQRLREDADTHYDTLIGSLLETVTAAKTTTYACRKCGKENTIQLPDVKARTQAIQLLIEQGYGKPAQTVTIEQDTLHGLGQLRAWLELMTDNERQVLSGFIDRVTSPGGTP